MSYGELERQSDVLAAALVAQGVEKGDRVALLMPNCPQFVVAELAAWKAGARSRPRAGAPSPVPAPLAS